MATSVSWYVILQEAITTMVDCNKGVQDGTMQHPTVYLCCIAGEQALIAKAQSARNEIHHNNDNITNAARQWQVWRLRTKILTKFMSYVLQTPRLQKT